jgi:4-hydroxyacetophenone monooxygenase
MAIFNPIEPIIEDDDTLRRMLRDADLPPLLPALAHVTGDLRLVAPELQPPRRAKDALIAPQGGMDEQTQERAREAAFQALRRFRDGGSRITGDLGTEDMRRLMRFLTGEVSEDYEPLLMQELGLAAEVGRPRWTKGEVAPDVDFSVVVVGGGMSGLAAAHHLDQAGLPFVVFERNDDVGGVWFENDYPGCRLDTNNFAYSYSFAQKDDWLQQYSRQSAIHGYFRDVAGEFGLRDRIRFRTEVVQASFDDETCCWTVVARDRDGSESTVTAQVVITAVGQLNQPSYPKIPGRERFAGPSFHTARWDHDVKLAGQRVAVIGTGASAYQVIPSIADEVAELRVFQRTPPWALPAPTYHEDIAPGLQWLFRHVPFYARWFRFYQFWIAVDGMHAFAVVDPEWREPGSVSAANARLRAQLKSHIEAQYTDRPDLLDKVVPSYPPYAKRMLRDNGVWAATLKKDHVSLVTEGLAEVTERGIRTVDGVEHEVDVIIYGTGFTASDFLSSMKVTGRGGVDLHEQWNGDARAYLGITIPGFPNFFCLYGPNTNLVLNGSIIMFSELAMDYVLECLRLLLSTGRRAMEVRPEVFEAHNQRIDEANRSMAWGVPEVQNWYKNATGRVSQNWPLHTLEYWLRTRQPAVDDYLFL